ncbi:MAG: hypothetical protein V4757_07215 [Pseudomonadota bacterium]
MKKQTRRKHYQLVNPILHAIAGAAITDTERLDKVRMIELQALEAFRTGAATKQDWDHMADMCNLCELMAKRGIGPEALEASERAQEALGEAHRRHVELGRIAVTGPEMQALRDVFEFHDLQRSSVSRAEYERAIRDTANRIRSAHPSLKVFMGAASP